MEYLLYIIAGASVGFAVGLTGVGGGSLMTPLLLMFGYPVPVAIGTDLLYAGLTKSGGAWFHHKLRNIEWRVMGLLALGSIPASLALNLLIIDDEFRQDDSYEVLLTTTLGIMLMLTALVVGFMDQIRSRLNGHPSPEDHTLPLKQGFLQRHASFTTWLMGIVLGVCVTLSSVGAGAFGAAALFILYPRMRTVRIVGTDIAHAVPLTLVAGLSYLYLGLVNFWLLGALLCGSLPGIWLGTRLGSHVPEKIMRIGLVCVLMALGIKFSFFPGH